MVIVIVEKIIGVGLIFICQFSIKIPLIKEEKKMSVGIMGINLVNITHKIKDGDLIVFKNEPIFKEPTFFIKSLDPFIVLDPVFQTQKKNYPGEIGFIFRNDDLIEFSEKKFYWKAQRWLHPP